MFTRFLLLFALLASLAAPAARAQTAKIGSTVTLTATADGTPPFTYQWSKGTSVIPGATSNVLTLSNVSLADSATYMVKISNPWGNVSTSAIVAVQGLPPSNPKISFFEQVIAWLKQLFRGRA